MLLIVKLKVLLLTLSYFFAEPYIIFIKLTKGENEMRKKAKKMSHLWSKSIFKWLNTNVEIINEENIPEGPVVVISNHQSSLDIPLLMCYLKNNPSFIAKKELKRIPVVSFWMNLLGCVYLDRKSPRSALLSFKKAAEIIQSGQSIVIFPEGTRSRELKEFKKGSFKLALMAGVPILPVTIIGTERVMDYKISQKKCVRILIEKPISIEQLSKEELKLIPEIVREKIEKNYNTFIDDSILCM
ncbi:MAG: 1-acyl-sn-glycerol-3-phosphate acyltransferase [Candidatus Delongbacteria bacterium]|nr:1-acyl-sn-glycerol-3-phosphate acyltransferase [Candidatus Delongbacteria bacterium]MBN2837095.1 1-acyl-sn-glycerol-3-phosphate acyltransferase [Candidatus Delongbacteria bacterium]